MHVLVGKLHQAFHQTHLLLVRILCRGPSRDNGCAKFSEQLFFEDLAFIPDMGVAVFFALEHFEEVAAARGHESVEQLGVTPVLVAIDDLESLFVSGFVPAVSNFAVRAELSTVNQRNKAGNLQFCTHSLSTLDSELVTELSAVLIPTVEISGNDGQAGCCQSELSQDVLGHMGVAHEGVSNQVELPALQLFCCEDGQEGVGDAAASENDKVLHEGLLLVSELRVREIPSFFIDVHSVLDSLTHDTFNIHHSLQGGHEVEVGLFSLGGLQLLGLGTDEILDVRAMLVGFTGTAMAVVSFRSSEIALLDFVVANVFFSRLVKAVRDTGNADGSHVALLANVEDLIVGAVLICDKRAFHFFFQDLVS